jgi:signal transduction histidine kinase
MNEPSKEIQPGRTRDEEISALVHDIRSQISVVNMSAQLMRLWQEHEPVRLDETAERIERSSRKLLALVHELRTYTNENK